MQGTFQNMSDVDQLSKKLVYLQKSLERTNIKINEGIHKNKELFQKISDLRKERVIYDKIYEGLELEYKDAKQEFIKSLFK